MRPKLRDVAALAGVSEATVSRVVNRRSGVAEPTRRAVLRAVAQLGYRAPVIAGLAAHPLAGVIVPELDNPVFPAFAQAIEARLGRHGFTTVICTATIGGTQESEYLDVLAGHGVRGVVVVSGLHADGLAEHGHYRRLADSGLAMVLVNGPLEGLDVPSVSADDVAAGELGVRHLAELGHRRIGFVTGPLRYLPSQRKLTGFARGLEAVGLEMDETLVVESVFSVEGGQLAMSRLLDLEVTGVLAGSDLMAIGAVRAVQERGLDVPGDVSVLGYDDIMLAPYAHPPLTTLRQPVRAMGVAAASMLVTELEGARPAHQGELLFRAELIVRGSTGPSRDGVAAAG